MVHGAVRTLFQVLGALGLLLLLSAAFLVWRLSQGPLPLDFLTPYIEDAMAEEDLPFRLELGETALHWERGDQSIELRIGGARAVDPEGKVMAAVPELAVTVDPRALFKGEVRLRGIEMISPFVQLVRHADGTLSLGLYDLVPSNASPTNGDAVLRALLDGLEGKQDGVAADLQAVRIVRARAVVDDRKLGVVWHVPRAMVELFRADDAIGLSSSLDVALPSGATHLDLVGEYRPGERMLDLGVNFDGFRPAEVANITDELEPLAALDLPLDGTITLTLAVTHTLEMRHAGLSATSGEGVLRLPPSLGADYPIKEASISAALADQSDEILIERFDVEFRGAGLGAGASLAGHLRRDEEGMMAGEAVATVRDVPLDMLQEWWPTAIAPDAREWVTENLSTGTVTAGEWTFALRGPALAEMEVADITGRSKVVGATVDYLRPMPPVKGVDAEVTFTSDKIDITTRTGTADGVRIKRGSVVVKNLQDDVQTAVVNLSLDSSLTDALRLIDSPPLGYATELGLSPATASGRVATELKLALPLIDDLRLDQLRVEADSVLEGVQVSEAVFGQDLTEGNLTLSVDTRGLNAEGQAYVGGVPAGFAWRENFGGKPFRSRYSVRAVIAEDKRGVFGLDVPPFTAPFMEGPVEAELELTVEDDQLSVLGARIDLSPAVLRIPGFDWTKPAGVPGQATVALRLENGKVRSISHFNVRAADTLEATGRVRFFDGGGVEKVEFEDLRVGESDMSGAVTFRPDGGYDIAVRGHAFDAVPFLKTQGRGPDLGEDSRLVRMTDADADLPPVTVRAAFDVVWVADDGTLEEVQVSLDRADGLWRAARLEGLIEGQTPFLFDLRPDAAPWGRRLFTAETADAGGLLRAFGLLSTMRGGRLTASGTTSPAGKAGGILKITDYRLVDAPVLARLLSVAALTGILDALTGEGLLFTRLEAPFVFENDKLTLKEFQAHGPSLGLTAEGLVNLDSDELALAGTLVPAYVLNSLPGKIPVVGGLLTGFEEGGGIFAATYAVRGRVDAPEIVVNPLTALAPGFLRNVLDIFKPGANGRTFEPVQP